MIKVDVAIQSYKKPEFLIYCLFWLHKSCRDSVDTIWINDDCSGEAVIKAYQKLSDSNVLHPWKIKIRQNDQRMGWWLSFVRGVRPAYQTTYYRLKRMLWNLYKVGSIYVSPQDLRYQWAIESTDKEYLFIMHDDIQFKSDIIKKYLNAITKDRSIAIVGDLGQCWRCIHAAEGCSPQKILEGYRPSNKWPSTYGGNKSHKWACRINEWSALLRVGAAKDIVDSEGIYFGNYDCDGDIAAYWFSRVIAKGYRFEDPLPSKIERNEYYIHWENGITGHSAWVDQGKGRNPYNADVYVDLLLKEFSYKY